MQRNFPLKTTKKIKFAVLTLDTSIILRFTIEKYMFELLNLLYAEVEVVLNNLQVII